MIHIVSDSTCDLSQELIDRYGIKILPLFVHLGSEEYRDGVDITPEDIYKWSDANQTTPRTAAVSIPDTMALFEKLTANGEELICFCISEQMSTTGSVMRLAAEELEKSDRIHVFDSANLSTGVGLLVLEAAEMAAAGKRVQEILSHLEEIRDKVRASFVVDTLTYLHRGGRCSGVAAFAGSKLGLHPIISVQGGKMLAGKKYRGKISRVLMDYAHDLEPAMREARPNRVFITHSGCEKADETAIYQYVESLGIFDEIHITRAGGVISSHCGPGTLGILFIAK